MTRLAIVILTLALFSPLHCGAAAESFPPGLTVQDGLFMRQGKPVHAIGMNYMDAFLRVIGHNGQGPRLDNDTWRAGFKVLEEYEIAFVRLPINGFYPADWKLYLDNRKVFFEKLDALVREAEARKIGLIPVFFWTFFTLPDIAGEPFDQWANPNSRTRALMRQFTREVVERYRASDAIWGWEFGNEYTNEADLPGDKQGAGWIVPRLGTPTSRTAADKVTRPVLRAAYEAFGRTVRELDATRPIFSGDSMARMSASHLLNQTNWTKDSAEEWLEVVKADTPDPLTGISIHLYYYDKPAEKAVAVPTGGQTSKPQRAEADPVAAPQENGIAGNDMAAMIRILKERGRVWGKPLYLGEFGTQFDLKDPERRRKQLEGVLAAVVAERPQLAAFWVFDFSWQALDSVTPWNDNAYMMEKLRDAGRQLKHSTTLNPEP